MRESSLAWLIKHGLYAVALMPLIIFSEFLSPFHFGKVVVFRVWMEILAIFYVVLVLKNKSYLPKSNAILWSVTAFTAVFGLTTLFSLDPYQSFWGTLERMGGWYTFFHFWLFFVMAVSVIRKQEEWLTFIKISVVTSLFSTFYGFLQKTDLKWVVGSGGRSRIFGTIGNPALFAGYELFNIFFALVLIFWSKISPRGRVFYAVIFLLNSIAVFSTAVRGSLLAAIVAFGLFALFYTYLGGAKKVRWAMLSGVAILVLLELFLILNNKADFVKNSPYFSRLADASLNTRTVNTRFWAWQAGIDGWNDGARTIVLGWGPENFNLPFSKHFNPKFYLGPGSETLFDRGHNMFVEVLVTMGLVGLLSYSAMLGVLGWSLRKIFKGAHSRDEKIASGALASGLVAYVIHNAFIFDTSANFMMFFLGAGFIYGLAGGLVTESSLALVSKKSAKHTPVFVITLAALVLSILVAFSIYQTGIKPALANYTSTRGIVASWAGDNKKAVAKFQEAMSYDTFGQYDIRHRYAQYVMENLSQFKESDAAVTREIRRELLLGVVENVKKNLRSGDKDYLPYLYISRAYILLGKDDPSSEYNDLALENSLRALSIAPEFIRTYFEVAQAYLNKKDYAKAAEYFKRAAELNPDVGVSYWYWAVTEFELGHTDKGWELLKKAEGARYGASEVDYSRLLGIYIKKNDFKRIAEIFEKIIAKGSTNPQDYASLATVYQKIGHLDGAEKMARKAVELDPTFEQEAKRFIESLGRKY